ncbi:MAG: hypothetical protein AB7F86_19880 [Bdellovibrionales bacterium]
MLMFSKQTAAEGLCIGKLSPVEVGVCQKLFRTLTDDSTRSHKALYEFAKGYAKGGHQGLDRLCPAYVRFNGDGTSRAIVWQNMIQAYRTSLQKPNAKVDDGGVRYAISRIEYGLRDGSLEWDAEKPPQKFRQIFGGYCDTLPGAPARGVGTTMASSDSESIGIQESQRNTAQPAVAAREEPRSPAAPSPALRTARPTARPAAVRRPTEPAVSSPRSTQSMR